MPLRGEGKGFERHCYQYLAPKGATINVKTHL
jgi:hypothetical protein